jgi:hypothetical protein
MGDRSPDHGQQAYSVPAPIDRPLAGLVIPLSNCRLLLSRHVATSLHFLF